MLQRNIMQQARNFIKCIYFHENVCSKLIRYNKLYIVNRRSDGDGEKEQTKNQTKRNKAEQ